MKTFFATIIVGSLLYLGFTYDGTFAKTGHGEPCPGVVK
jgi:hypothetical protein